MITVCDFKVVVKWIKSVSQGAICSLTNVIPSSPELPISPKAITHRSKFLSYILYDRPITEHGIGQEFSFGKKGVRQMQCCQYIMADRGKFDDRGLTETGSSSSISNLFVSATILTDKQSVCNNTWNLTERDSASIWHEDMALSAWIGNK